MRKLILIVHTSIDGFVAGKNGEFDGFKPSPENLEFVCSLTDEADAALMGRVSYEMLESGWPHAWEKPGATPSEIKYSHWYNAAEKIVISKTLERTNLHNLTIIPTHIEEEILKIKKHKGKDILLFGSPTVFQTLADLNVIDEYWIIVYPAIFGKGILLFSHNSIPKKMTLLNTKQLSNGEIALHYKIEE